MPRAEHAVAKYILKSLYSTNNIYVFFSAGAMWSRKS